jgi:hypothetical protein
VSQKCRTNARKYKTKFLELIVPALNAGPMQENVRQTQDAPLDYSCIQENTRIIQDIFLGILFGFTDRYKNSQEVFLGLSL